MTSVNYVLLSVLYPEFFIYFIRLKLKIYLQPLFTNTVIKIYGIDASQNPS